MFNLKFYKISITAILCIILLANNSFAQGVDKLGLCLLDRTVESLDFRTWLSAKSRASSDVIPIRFNDKLLYIGTIADNIQYTTYRHIDLGNDLGVTIYTRANDKTSFLLQTNNITTIGIFIKSEIGPYFMGNCELK